MTRSREGLNEKAFGEKCPHRVVWTDIEWYQQAPDGHRAALHLPMWGLLYGWHGSLHGPCSIPGERTGPTSSRQLTKLLSEARLAKRVSLRHHHSANFTRLSIMGLDCECIVVPHALTTRCPTLNSLTCAIFPHSPHQIDTHCTGLKISQLNRATNENLHHHHPSENYCFFDKNPLRHSKTSEVLAARSSYRFP